jgi:hypothetical protein
MSMLLMGLSGGVAGAANQILRKNKGFKIILR